MTAELVLKPILVQFSIYTGVMAKIEAFISQTPRMDFYSEVGGMYLAS